MKVRMIWLPLAVLFISSFAFAANMVPASTQVGYYFVPAPEYDGQYRDYAPSKAFELVRPGMQALRVGRMNTSCTCANLTTAKTSYDPGERAIFHLRNVRPTPATGQNYAFNVQVNMPDRTMVSHSQYLISDQFTGGGPAYAAAPSQSYPPVTTTYYQPSASYGYVASAPYTATTVPSSSVPSYERETVMTLSDISPVY